MLISSATADTIFTYASAATVACGVITAFAEIHKHRKPRGNQSPLITVGGPIATAALAVIVWWSGYIRDDYSDRRISENEKATALANQAAAIAQKEAGEAAERTALVQSENAKLQIQLEADRSARLALERKIAPRRLSSLQKEKLVEILRPFAGQSVRVISPPAAEQMDLAIDFVDVFKRAGWNIVSANGTPIGVDRIEYMHEPQGIQLAVDPAEPSRSRPRQALETLRRFLFAQKLTSLKSPVKLFHDRLPGIIEVSTARKPD